MATAMPGTEIAQPEDKLEIIVVDDWLERGLAAFSPGVHAVCGRVVMPIPATSILIPPLSVFGRLVGDQVPRGVHMRLTARTCKGCAVYRGHF